MSLSLTYLGAYPIGDTDVNALPVKDIPSAVGYYTQVLGFSLVSRNDKTAILRRDEATIGLAVNGSNPEQASIYLSVNDVEAARAELAARHIEPTALRDDQYGGKVHRVFFVREPFGVCFCIGQTVG